ncbi:MAG: sigma factor-like helix-turn-helix DNA-binding protein [Solirubrobacteraceae bacterium]
MDEVHEFCRRVLGAGAAADEAALEARESTGAGRVEMLGAAGRACRARAAQRSSEGAADAEPPGAPAGLLEAVSLELAQANARLPERQREALALRELLRLSYDQISKVIGIEGAALAPLLARARLRLRAQRRGVALPGGSDCGERDRALRVLARRQDSEPLSGEDDLWLLEHLGVCAQCSQAHAAMLEASACYRAWPAGPVWTAGQ